MGMQNCGACGSSARVMKLATIIGDGPARRARVCPACAKRGVFVVPVTRAVVNDTSKAEAKEARDVLAPFVKRCEGLSHAKRTQLAKLAPTARADELAAIAAAAEVYEAIAHMLKEGRA